MSDAGLQSSVEFPIPKATLLRFGLRPKKSFGQNFLSDPRLVDRIASLAGTSEQHVVEIGAGLGGLTACLLARGHVVTAVERDRDLLPVLRELFATPIAEGQLSLLEADAKTVPLTEPFTSGTGVLMGNLPYQITGPLLQRTIAERERLTRAVFLVQKEVADRIAAGPGTKTYGALSVFCQAAFEVRREFIVRRGAFYPQPNVDSAVVSLIPHPTVIAEETPRFAALVHAAFRERRKVLKNAWSRTLGMSNEQLQQAARGAEIALDVRGETLDVSAFARMAQQVELILGPAEMGEEPT